MLETFSEKPTCPILKFTYHPKRSGGLKGPRNRSYKKEKKENVRNVFREAHLSNPKVYLPFQPIPRDPGVQRSKKPFLQKRKEKNISNVLFQKKTPTPKLTFKKIREGEGKRGRERGKKRGKEKGKEKRREKEGG